MDTRLESGESRNLLKGSLNTRDIVFTVIGYNGPFVVFTGFIPVIVSQNTLGASVVYMICCATLLLFSVGFTLMARYVPNPGGFYAFVTAGLGKPMGLGGSFLSVLCYYATVLGLYFFFGVMASHFVEGILGGPHVPAPVYSFLLLITVAVLGFFQISLSAKVLGIFMGLEILTLLAFSVVSFITGGAEGMTYEPLNPGSLVGANIGLALLFGFLCYGGFETTVIYREEAVEPRRTIPRATYLAVIILSALFILTSWAFVVAWGPANVIETSAADPTAAAMTSLTMVLGNFVGSAVELLVLTSIFACALSSHNVAARYKFSLSVDGVLRRRLSTVHGTHGSPYVSSVVCSVICAVVLAIAVGLQVDLVTTFVLFAAIAAYILLLLQAVTSLAVITYFKSNPQPETSVFRTLVAPAISTVALAIVTVLATVNFDGLAGGSVGWAILIQIIIWVTLIFGVLYAFYLKGNKPDVYARIGRQLPMSSKLDDGDTLTSPAR